MFCDFFGWDGKKVLNLFLDVSLKFFSHATSLLQIFCSPKTELNMRCAELFFIVKPNAKSMQKIAYLENSPFLCSQNGPNWADSVRGGVYRTRQASGKLCKRKERCCIGPVWRYSRCCYWRGFVVGAAGGEGRIVVVLCCRR